MLSDDEVQETCSQRQLSENMYIHIVHTYSTLYYNLEWQLTRQALENAPSHHGFLVIFSFTATLVSLHGLQLTSDRRDASYILIQLCSIPSGINFDEILNCIYIIYICISLELCARLAWYRAEYCFHIVNPLRTNKQVWMLGKTWNEIEYIYNIK